jgi:hypothetical protein
MKVSARIVPNDAGGKVVSPVSSSEEALLRKMGDNTANTTSARVPVATGSRTGDPA